MELKDIPINPFLCKSCRKPLTKDEQPEWLGIWNRKYCADCWKAKKRKRKVNP